VAVLSSIDSGKPAFVEGIRTGDEVTEINGIKNPYFDDLLVQVMGAARGEEVAISLKRPGDKEARSLEIVPSVDKRPQLGISAAYRTQLASKRYVGELKHPVMTDSPAAAARPSFNYDDVIVAMTNPEPPYDVTPLGEKGAYFEYLRRLQLLLAPIAEGKINEIVFRVDRKDSHGAVVPIDVKVSPAFHRTLGVRMAMGEIGAIRKKSPAAAAKMQAPDPDKKLEGDRIQWVEVTWPEKDGAKKPKVTKWEGPTLDPLRLRDQLRAWAAAVYKANPKPSDKDLEVRIHVKRHNATSGPQYSYVTLPLVWDNDWRFDRINPHGLSSPFAIGELGFAYHVQTTVAGLEPSITSNDNDLKGEGPFFKEWAILFRNRSLQEGDEIKDVRFHYQTQEGALDGPWLSKQFKRDMKPGEWAHVFWTLQTPSIDRATLKVKRGDKIIEVELTPYEDKTWPSDELGLILMPDQKKEKADNFIDAIRMGFRDTSRNMSQVFSNLRGMITGQISVENLGGPVTIARVAYRIAGVDIWEFIFFIGLISINLAVINFLPIPVLDGGHMVFLIYEKITGRPAPESFRIGATWLGLNILARPFCDVSLLIAELYNYARPQGCKNAASLGN
jgi:regulator of sigma E protease